MDACPMCGSQEWTELGPMGTLIVLRCRACYTDIMVDPEELAAVAELEHEEDGV